MTFKSFFTLTVLTVSALIYNSTNAATQELSDQTFNNFINSSTVIVKFSAPWCGPCKQMAPMFEEVSNQYPNIKFGKIDTDRCSQTANRFNVRSVPTTIFFKNGKEIKRINGAPSRPDFINTIKSIS